jgi:hypothetical protein
MTNPVLMPSPRQFFRNNLGLPAAGCKLYTFEAGTSTPKPCFQDPAGLTPHENPITLDAKGECLAYFDGAYKIDLRTPFGAQVTGYPVDDFSTDTATALQLLLAGVLGSGLIGHAGAKNTVKDQLDILHYGIANITDKSFAGGCKGDGNAATYTGTDNSAAIQAAINSALTAGVVAQGGKTLFAPTGVYCFDTTINIDTAGVSFLRMLGNGNSTRFIKRGGGRAFNFIGSSFDGDYPKLNSRIVLEDFMVYGDPPLVAGGDTTALSFINCAELKITNVMAHYAGQGFYIQDTPSVTMNMCEAVDCKYGISLKKTTLTVNSDMAGVSIYSPICSGNQIDLKIDGARDVNVYGGILASTQCVNIRASGSTSAGDQVENVKFFGTFFDYQDYTTPTIQIGDPADASFQIKQVTFDNCSFASNPAFTKAVINCNSPLLLSVVVNGGYCSEIVPKFLVIGAACLSTLRPEIKNLGTNSCLSYRITDERSGTKRSELFNHSPSLQRNPDFIYFPVGGYFPFGYGQTQVGNIARSTAAFVTGDCALTLVGTGNPVPAASCIWYPQYGDITVDQGTDLAIEWIVNAPTTPANATLWISTTNIDGTGAAETVADPVLTSTVQAYINGFKRMVHAYRVPNNKVVTSIRVHGAVGETLNVDYFQVYGPVKYRPDEMLYPGAAAHFADANFKVAKFRAQKAQKRVAGEADEIYMCRKDAAGTYSWQLIA